MGCVCGSIETCGLQETNCTNFPSADVTTMTQLQGRYSAGLCLDLMMPINFPHHSCAMLRHEACAKLLSCTCSRQNSGTQSRSSTLLERPPSGRRLAPGTPSAVPPSANWGSAGGPPVTNVTAPPAIPSPGVVPRRRPPPAPPGGQ